MVQVSLSTSTNYDGELNALLEDQGTALTVSFDLDEPAPEGGLKVYVDSDVEQIVNRLDLPGFGGNPIVENINPSLLGTNFDNSGFYLTIDQGATSASFTINVFDNEEPDTFQPETFDGLVEAVFQLKTQEQVDSQDLGDVGNLSDYTIDSNAATSRVLFADEESQLTEEPPEPTPEPNPTPEPTPGTGLPLVSLNTGPDYLVEEDGTVSAHVFNVTRATIPEGGIVVGVNAPNLNEFDLDAIEVGNGGEIVNVREDGFDIRLTDFTTLVNLPVAADGEVEGLETASFSLVAGDGYEVNEDLSSGSFSIVDTREEVPDNFSEPNDTIPTASDIGLSSDNSQISFTETFKFEISNRYPNEDSSFSYVDKSEDVDFYKFELQEGDVVAIDFDSDVLGNPSLPNLEFNPFGTIGIQNIFDEEGNILDYAQLRPAPGETLASGSDSYIEFEAREDGTYYMGLSVFRNGLSNRQILFPEDANLAYDPFEAGSGTGRNFGTGFGEYELNFTLNPDTLVDLPELNRSNNTPPETVDVAEPGEPTVTLNFLDVEFSPFSNEIVGRNFVENTDGPGFFLGFTLETEGEIPEEGIEVVLNSDIYLRDYIGGFGGVELVPFSPGAEFVEVVTDDTGLETGFKIIILEPNTFFGFNVGKNSYFDGFLEPETDGPEDATFFLEGGEGYGVNENANQFTVTFYDSEEQAPPPTDIIPEVSFSVSETEIIESEGTETTLEFSLSEPPPEEGVVLYVSSENEGILQQFGVLEAEVSGGVFPIPDSDLGGFYFKITEQEASINLAVFADPFEEGLQSYSFTLEETPFYTIDPDAGEVNFTIADTPDSIIEVGLSSESYALVEEGATSTLIFGLTNNLPGRPLPEVTVNIDAPNLSEFDVNDFTVNRGEITEVTDTGFSIIPPRFGTTTVDLPLLLEEEVSVNNENVSVSEVIKNALTFNLTAVPPSEGVTVTVDAPNLSEFNVDAFTVNGGEITEITEEGFSLNITDATATVELPLLADGEAEGLETATFSLVETDNSTIDPEASEVTFTLADAPEQVPVTEELDAPNETISDALDISPNLKNPAAVRGSIEQIADEIDFTEDVDFYSFDLEAEDTVKIDIDSVPFEIDQFQGVEQRLDSELRLFDADGNELASVNNAAAPDEEFSRDPYLEFTAESAGSYYVGVSQLGNNNYDPNVEGSGSGWIFPEIGVFSGEYDLNVSLTSGNAGEQPTTEPVFGSLEADIIEVTGTSQLIFGGDSDDLIDASISSEGNNRIYAGSGDDTLILGNGDRLVGGEGADKFFAMSGGDNIITGGEGADQFWIATAEIPGAANIITDFTSGEDVLGIAGLGIGFDDLSITQQDDNTLIAANNSELAILQGIGADSLIADNFAFG